MSCQFSYVYTKYLNTGLEACQNIDFLVRCFFGNFEIFGSIENLKHKAFQRMYLI